MKRVMVRYQVRPDQVAENRRLVGEVFAELARAAPPGIRYATLVLDDGVTFVHLASIETADGANPLTALTAFQRFSQSLAARALAPPVVTVVEVVGAYRLFGDAAGEVAAPG